MRSVFSKVSTVAATIILLGFFCANFYDKNPTNHPTEKIETEVIPAPDFCKISSNPIPAQTNQNNWLQKVQQDIASREYHINYAADKKYHQSPNRANNTRITYYPRSIQIAPRTLEEYEETPSTELYAERKLSKTFEDYTLQLEVKGYGTTKKLVHPFHAEKLMSENSEAFAQDGHMQVEYINNEEGTRQNFIINQPINGNELAVHLNINTSLTATQENEGSIKFTGKQKNTQLYYNDLKVWDATGKILPAQMKLSNEGQTYALVLAVNTTGAEYPITIDPIVASGNLTNADWKVETNSASSFMGNSVSSAGDVNGDGYSDVIVAAYGRTSSFTSEGAVYIYHGSATGLSTSANRTILGGAANLWFGSAVATAGDINADGYSDVLIGSDNYTNGQTNEGAVYIYHGSASGIAATPTSIVESNIANGYMGRELSTAGDLNGDGYSDIVVGAESFSNGQSSEGAFWIFQGSSSGINSTPMLFVESNQASWWMGKGVGGGGDINADGYSDLLIGLYGYENGQTAEGATYVYYGSSSGITSATPGNILEGNVNNIRMGESVSSAGDVNGDGYSDIVVGLLGYTNGQTQEGAAYIYHGSASGINTTLATKVESNRANANMGSDVGYAGDVNGDGYSDIVIGAYSYTNGQNAEGAIFVYGGSSTGINTAAIALIQSDIASTRIGISCSSAGDVNGDGYTDVIAGGYWYSNGEANEGIACAFYGGANTISFSNNWIESNLAGAFFGANLRSAGDINGDGYTDVIIGANGYTNGQTQEGAFYIYHGSNSGLSSSPTTFIESNMSNSIFGSSVFGAGDINGDGYDDIVVGAALYDNGQNDEGAFFVYHGSASGLNTTAAIMIESNIVGAYLGNSGASAGDLNGDGYSDIIVGASNYSNGQNNEGAFFVYHGGSGGISINANVMVESNQTNGFLGRSVSCAGDVNGDGYSDIIVGYPYYTNGQTDEGAALIYHGSSSGISSNVTRVIEGNQSLTGVGWSVSCAGDVNGDGYSDVIIGARAYDNDIIEEGACFIYHGSSSGIGTNAAVMLDGNQGNSLFGDKVSGVGDINGDGYSDIIVGAPSYDNGTTDEGAAFVYLGSSNGINITPSRMIESNQANSFFGVVSGIGDVNGDGYSDVAVGAPYFDAGQTNEGIVITYYGNSGLLGRRNNIRLYNTDLTTPIQQSNKSNSSFGLGLFTSSPEGRQKVKMVWEVKTQGQPFSSAGGTITNSVSNTSVQSSYSNTGLTGTNLNNLVSKAGFQTKVRCRVQYDLVTSVTGQKYGPWRYPQGYLNGQQGKSSTPLPVEWLSFTAQWLTTGESAQLNWSTASEKDNSHFTLLRSIDEQNWEEVTQVNGAGTTNNISNYTFIDNSLKHLNTSTPKHVYYRLMQTDYNGQFSFSDIRELTLVPSSGISVSPNPGINQIITLNQPSATDLPYTIIDVQGRQVGSGIIPKGRMQCTIDLQYLPSGVYFLSLERDGRKESIKLIRQ